MRLSREDKEELLVHSSHAKTGKRFASFAIDFIFLFISGFLVFLLSHSIITNTDSYKNNVQTVNDEIDYYLELIKPTHLGVYFDNEGEEVRYTDNEIFAFNNITKWMVFSNEHDPSGKGWYEEVKSRGLLNVTFKDTLQEELDDLMKNKPEDLYLLRTFAPSSYEEDDIAYFYCTYVPTHNNDNDLIDFKGQDPKEYYVKKLEEQFADNIDKYLRKSDDESLFPYVLNKDVCIAMFLSEHYKNYEGDYYKFYDNLGFVYDNLETDAETLLVNAKSYFDSHYKAYVDAYLSKYRVQGYAALIGFTVAYIIYAIVFKIIFKFEATPGRLLLKLGVLSKYGEQTKPWMSVVRSLLGYVAFFPTIFFYMLLPPFALSSMPLAVPIITIGGTGITIMALIFVAMGISLLSFCFIAFSHYHNGFTELISQTVVLDTRHVDEYDFDEPGEGAL